MKLPSPLTSRLWMLIPIAACGFLFWTNQARIQRIAYVTAVGRDEVSTIKGSPRREVGGMHELIVPEHISNSFEWIVQTQQMLARREWRVRQIDYENAPDGRQVHAASPYRWWLGLIAGLDHWITGVPLGLAVERAALYADPLLHGLLVIVTSLFVARQFGTWAAALCAMGLIALFPFAAGFLPGVPDDFALLLALAPWGLLPLLAGIRSLATERPLGPAGGVDDSHAQHSARPALRWFAFGGLVGGLGLWINVAGQVPLLLGLGVGALLAAWSQRSADRENSPGVLPPAVWRAWSLGGAATVLVACLIEYFPAHLGNWELRVIHPLYGLAWLGGGELLWRIAAWIQRGKVPWNVSGLAIMACAVAAITAVPVVMWQTGNLGFLAVDVLSFRLTKQAAGIMAPNTAVWLSSAGMTAPAWATILPLLFFGTACWLALRRNVAVAHRGSLAMLIGPVVVGLVLAYAHLRWWQMLGGTLLAVMVAATTVLCANHATRVQRWLWAGLAVLVLLPGALQLVPAKGSVAKNVLTRAEGEALVERDLAQWLASHSTAAGAPVILAPPRLTASLNYYGGLRGLGTLSWENNAGLAVGVRIVISTSREEAHALLQRRGVTHIILPSWDDFFESYKRSASIQTNELFYVGLDRWALPAWLRPVPYQLPAIAGFERYSVRILEVVDEQDEPVAASRLTEYFIEMGQLENARIADQRLRRYPADFGALVARAQLEAALVDAEGFTRVFETLLQRLADGADRGMPWDRRVSLAIVLARGKRMDLARVQVQRCLAELTEQRLRSLTTYSLYHLLVMNKALGLEIADPRLRAQIEFLLPADLRKRT